MIFVVLSKKKIENWDFFLPPRRIVCIKKHHSDHDDKPRPNTGLSNFLKDFF